jgi:hypothetical protein
MYSMGRYLPATVIITISLKLTRSKHLPDAPRRELEDLCRIVDGVEIAWFHAGYRTLGLGLRACEKTTSRLQEDILACNWCPCFVVELKATVENTR